MAVPLPDIKGRTELIDYYLHDKPFAADVDRDVLARQTQGMGWHAWGNACICTWVCLRMHMLRTGICHLPSVRGLARAGMIEQAC